MLFGVWSSFTLFGMIDNTIDGSAASKALWYLTGLLVALKSCDAKENNWITIKRWVSVVIYAQSYTILWFKLIKMDGQEKISN